MDALPLRSEAVQPSRTETMSLLAGICGPEHVQAEKDGTLRCDEAPGYPYEDNARCGLDIRGVLHGHFTSPQADEVVADYRNGCERPIEHFGGLVLLRQQDGIWRRIFYFRSHRAARCLVFRRRDGRDALVCGNAHNLQGDRHADIEMIELRSQEIPVSVEDLLEAHSDEGTALCEGHAAGQRQLHSRLKGWEHRPATQGAPEQLVVQVETEDFVTPGFCGKPSTNRDLDERSAEALNDKFAAFRAEQRRIETVTFDWDGERFRPSSPPSSPAIDLKEQPSDDEIDDYDDSDVLELTLHTENVQPSQTETRSLLAGICGPEHVQAEKDGSLYCDQAPGYPDPDFARCGLDIGRGVLHGHFTSPQADEVVADYRGGCEAHVHDSGGSILLRKKGGIWRRIAYFPGERAARCLVFRHRGGRDALVCGSAFSGQGEHDANIELRSLKPGVKPEDLLGVHSLEGTNFCEGFAAGKRQLHTRFKDWERRPATKGAPERLVVQVETEDFVTPGFCGKSSDDDTRSDFDSYEELDDATAEALEDRFEAFREQHRRIETVTFNWNGERFVKK